MITFAGFKVIKVDDLPAGTMLVSADVYEALSQTPAERVAKADRLVKDMQAIGDRLRGLTVSDRLNPMPAGATHKFKDHWAKKAAGTWYVWGFLAGYGPRWLEVHPTGWKLYENEAVRIPGTN